jgi:peptide subunit release factor 1 (eRF1)
MKENKLIAEFMGIYNVHEDNGRYSCNNCGYEYSAMMGDNEIPMIHSECKPDIVELAKYHTSWNWLMPVVEKIESLGYEVQIRNTDCIIFQLLDTLDYKPVIGSISSASGKMDSTYIAVVEFIKKHNDVEVALVQENWTKVYATTCYKCNEEIEYTDIFSMCPLCLQAI